MPAYGSGGYGYGMYGGFTDQYDNLDAFRDALTDVSLRYRTDSNLAKLIRALLVEANFLSFQTNAILDAHHVDTATGSDLDKLGRLVGVTRQTGETDDHFRVRIKAYGYINVSSATTNDLIHLTGILLQTAVENVTVTSDLAANPATFQCAGPVVDTPLTDTEVESILNDAVAAGHITSFTITNVSDGQTYTVSSPLTVNNYTLDVDGTLTVD
jgi:hypothetical protein